jgi:hypothetical protein
LPQILFPSSIPQSFEPIKDPRGKFFTPEVTAAMDGAQRLPTFVDLAKHVLHKLCEPDKLDPRQTPLMQSVITRRGVACGVFFQAQGPRLLKSYAVWAGDENRILFYNCNGERVAETRLSEAPDPACFRDNLFVVRLET